MVGYFISFGAGFICGTKYSAKKLGHEYKEIIEAAKSDAEEIKTKATGSCNKFKERFKKDKVDQDDEVIENPITEGV